MQPLEIEFLPVGEGSRAGDAIAVRYETSPGYFGLIVIDGGTIASGEAMVEYLQALCHGNTPIVSDLVVSHPDQDHSSGARVILENVEVRRVWTHVPWWHVDEALPHFKSTRWTKDGLEKCLRQEYDVIDDIVALAIDKGAAIQEPFAGDTIGPFTVLSPPRWAYPVLLANFPDTPAPAAPSAGLGALGLLSAGLGAVTKAVQSLTESWMMEWLRDGGVTSPRNESSVVLYGQFDGWKPVLLTADAGNIGLTWAAETADGLGLPLQDFDLAQIPHHGSRRNVGPTILDRLIGGRQWFDTTSRFTAVVSAPKDDADHPRKIVLNAFMRRGAKVLATQGSQICWGAGFPHRPGYGPAGTMPFSTMVEGYD